MTDERERKKHDIQFVAVFTLVNSFIPHKSDNYIYYLLNWFNNSHVIPFNRYQQFGCFLFDFQRQHFKTNQTNFKFSSPRMAIFHSAKFRSFEKCESVCFFWNFIMCVCDVCTTLLHFTAWNWNSPHKMLRYIIVQRNTHLESNCKVKTTSGTHGERKLKRETIPKQKQKLKLQMS